MSKRVATGSEEGLVGCQIFGVAEAREEACGEDG